MFTTAQIEELRKQYATIDRVDPCAPTYKRLIAMLDSLTQEHLRLLSDAQIRWVSMLAKNRLGK